MSVNSRSIAAPPEAVAPERAEAVVPHRAQHPGRGAGPRRGRRLVAALAV